MQESAVGVPFFGVTFVWCYLGKALRTSVLYVFLFPFDTERFFKAIALANKCLIMFNICPTDDCQLPLDCGWKPWDFAGNLIDQAILRFEFCDILIPVFCPQHLHTWTNFCLFSFSIICRLGSWRAAGRRGWREDNIC